MTYQQAAEFLDDHDLRVLILPDRTGFAVFKLSQQNVVRTLGLGDTFESAVAKANQALGLDLA